MDSLFLADLDREQKRHIEDARELWRTWTELSQRRDDLAGALAWKTVKGREYLVHYRNDEDTGDKRMTSLGPRSEETEKRKSEWERDREAVDAAIAKLKPRLESLGRVSRALRLGRLETAAADVLRELHRAGTLGSSLIMGGSAVMHLYEASAGALVPNSVLPHGDLDLMIVDEAVDRDDLVRFLRRADRGFRPRDTLTFATTEGFRVDFFPESTLRAFYSRMPDLSSDQRRVIDEAFNLPPVHAVGVARDGLPVPMVGIDPRSFAVLKFARAEFDPDRDRNPAEIDRDQAFVIAALVGRYWRHEFDPSWLEAFPGLAEGFTGEAPEDRGPRFFM
jgi:hypothetical protein